MCNAYNLAPPVSSREVERAISAKIAALPSSLIRRTGPGIVVTGIEGELDAHIMRWGFFHPQYKTVNNTRATSLKSPMWAGSLRERRCIVPITEFYEWEELPENAPKGAQKSCYSFKRADGGTLWVVGLWQHFEGIGDCYSTITRFPAPPVHPLHDRQLASFPLDTALAFLAGEKVSWEPDGGGLVATLVPSPLRKNNRGGASGHIKNDTHKKTDDGPPPAVQGDLF